MKIASSSSVLALLCFLLTSSHLLCSSPADPTDSSVTTASEEATGTSAGVGAVTGEDEKSKPKPVKVKRTKKKSTRDWDKLSENDLEKDWEQGDEEFELEHEFERIQKIQAKKSEKMSSVLDSNDPAQISKL